MLMLLVAVLTDPAGFWPKQGQPQGTYAQYVAVEEAPPCAAACQHPPGHSRGAAPGGAHSLAGAAGAWERPLQTLRDA